MMRHMNDKVSPENRGLPRCRHSRQVDAGIPKCRMQTVRCAGCGRWAQRCDAAPADLPGLLSAQAWQPVWSSSRG